MVQLHFLVKSTKGVTSNKFLIKDLTGTSGRLDIIFRCLLAAFSFGSRNIFFHAVLNGPPNPPKALTFNGNRVGELPIDEIGMAHLFQTLLDPTKPLQKEGITLVHRSFLDLASELAQEGPVFLLKENFPPFKESLVDLQKEKHAIHSIIFILSDHIDLEPQEEEFLINKLQATRVNLGSRSYLASHSIIFLLMKLGKLKF
ncbi:MAG: hypothetical protein HWN65_14670 [Candidatus Helarchaeota archaeon]|nr:hypothetical protein [Candidatus Helarchaeota archaeon]